MGLRWYKSTLTLILGILIALLYFVSAFLNTFSPTIVSNFGDGSQVKEWLIAAGLAIAIGASILLATVILFWLFFSSAFKVFTSFSKRWYLILMSIIIVIYVLILIALNITVIFGVATSAYISFVNSDVGQFASLTVPNWVQVIYDNTNEHVTRILYSFYAMGGILIIIVIVNKVLGSIYNRNI